jgi:hypothetical protein
MAPVMNCAPHQYRSRAGCDGRRTDEALWKAAQCVTAAAAAAGGSVAAASAAAAAAGSTVLELERRLSANAVIRKTSFAVPVLPPPAPVAPACSVTVCHPPTAPPQPPSRTSVAAAAPPPLPRPLPPTMRVASAPHTMRGVIVAFVPRSYSRREAAAQPWQPAWTLGKAS